jgi:hypothetical protein
MQRNNDHSKVNHIPWYFLPGVPVQYAPTPVAPPANSVAPLPHDLSVQFPPKVPPPPDEIGENLRTTVYSEVHA